MKTNFVQIAQNEFKFKFMDKSFIIKERKVGCLGLGRCISLYQLDGVDMNYIKTIGWTKSDNHNGPGNNTVLKGIVTVEQCKTEALRYLEQLLS